MATSDPFEPPSSEAVAPRPNAEKLPWATVHGFSVGAFGQGLLPILVASQLQFFYDEKLALLSLTVFGAIRFIERLLGAFIEPVIGHLSDGTRSRWGRRRPWMAVGLPFLCISFAFLWFPPDGAKDSPAVIAHLAIALMVFYASYTCVFAPYNALLPELSRDSAQRIRLSVWMAIFETLATIFGTGGSAFLLSMGATVFAGIAFANGHEVMGIIAGVIAFLSVVPVLVFAPEQKPADEEHPMSLWRALIECLKNAGFRRYAMAILGFRAATFAAVVGTPYVGSKLMGLDDGTAQAMLAVIILVAAFAFPVVQWLANKVGKARVLRWGGLGFIGVLPLMGTIGLVPINPFVHGAVLFVLAGFSVATLFILPRPILADVIDDDEKVTGLRREAIYTGMSGVVEKMGEAISAGMVPMIFAVLGSTAENPLGLRLFGVYAAIAIGLGLYGFRNYSDPK